MMGAFNKHAFMGSCCFAVRFDVEDMTPSSGAGNKVAALQRRMSMYSQGTPENAHLQRSLLLCKFCVLSGGEVMNLRQCLHPASEMLNVQC